MKYFEIYNRDGKWFAIFKIIGLAIYCYGPYNSEEECKKAIYS